MLAGRIDLTIGYGIVLWPILAISLQTKAGFPWELSVLVVLACGALTGFVNGILVEVQTQIGQACVGLEYLLPALVGVFLGSTTIKPGRVNVWGTVVAVLVLAIGISGIQQFGGEFYVEPLFNGGALIAAIALAGYSQRHRRSAQ